MLTKKESLKPELKTNKNTKLGSLTETQENYQTHQSTSHTYDSTTSHGTSPYTEHASYTEHTSYSDKKTHQKTRIIVKYNTGYGNQIYIRGKGANLSWDKGTPLKNVKADEWVWETEAPFSYCEFKVLINDRNYENGENHYLHQGANIVYTPHFTY